MASTFSRLAGYAAILALSGCATESSAMLPSDSRATLDPIAFFTGRSHGDGELDTLVSSPVRITVDSVGRREGDMLILDQTIREGAKPPRVRRWTMRRTAPGTYSGTLTPDAVGAVHVKVEGPRAYIKYRMKGGFAVDQQLALQSDGRTLLNRLQVFKLGLRVATVDETIRKLD